jgi:hypothetical protein
MRPSIEVTCSRDIKGHAEPCETSHSSPSFPLISYSLATSPNRGESHVSYASPSIALFLFPYFDFSFTQNCSESKVRCDRQAPQCGRCFEKGKECRYFASDNNESESPSSSPTTTTNPTQTPWNTAPSLSSTNAPSGWGNTFASSPSMGSSSNL